MQSQVPGPIPNRNAGAKRTRAAPEASLSAVAFGLLVATVNVRARLPLATEMKTFALVTFALQKPECFLCREGTRCPLVEGR
jgi:hypothetical protein